MSRNHEMDARVIGGTLRRCPFFAGLDAGTLSKLAELMETRHFDPGEALYRPGDESSSLVVLALGQVEFFVVSEGRERVVGVVSPVSSFGELSLLVGGQRPMGARAVEEVAVHELTQGTLKMLERSDPELALQLLALLRMQVGQTLAGCNDILLGLFKRSVLRSTLGA